MARSPAGSQVGRLRFATTDVAAARERLRGSNVTVGPVEELPDVVRYCDFGDPWGNRLGLYQDLARWPATPWMAALSAHIHRFNTAVRSGDWSPFVATFAGDAVMHVVGWGVPLHGREVIAEAYASQPPEDTMHLRTACLDGDRITAAFGWDRVGGGSLTLRLAGGEVAELTVAFDAAARQPPVRPGRGGIRRVGGRRGRWPPCPGPAGFRGRGGRGIRGRRTRR